MAASEPGEVTLRNGVWIDCTPEAAFAYVADIATHPHWSVDDIRVVTRPAGQVTVGCRYRTIGHSVVRGQDQEADLEVTRYEPPRAFGFRACSGPREFHHVFTFEPELGGTRLERAMTFTPDAETRARMQVLSDQIAEHNRASMGLLKERLEEG